MGKKKTPKIIEPLDLSVLHEQVVPVLLEDSMAEAGRKILLRNFVQMLSHEPGARTGEEIENVHQMRVATRRMRSAFRVFKPYYKTKVVQSFVKSLKTIADALGVIRDLDVMIDDLEQHQAKLAQPDQPAHQATIDQLNARRDKTRGKLIVLLDSDAYQQFVQVYANFLTQPGKGLKGMDTGGINPYQVRHVVPVVIHHYLANVRAYDVVIENAELATLHALRIDFKQLRYTIAHFSDVLGTTSQQFIKDIKTMQDYLGRLNDIRVARPYLKPYLKGKRAAFLDDVSKVALQTYLVMLKDEETQRYIDFPEAWAKFNTRTVQRKLADSLLVLR
jgi:CHAD domain-containing protein